MELKNTQWNIFARPNKMPDVYGGSSTCIDSMIKPFVKEHSISGQWPKGILLTGKPGGGKTTIAKIIAMSMACKHLDTDGNPCGECQDCKSIINEVWNRDVKLVNAAELKNNGESSVDGMKRLVESSRTLPFFGKRKVIIIDEIQEILKGNMKASVNVLLKELERKEGKTCWIFTSMEDIPAEMTGFLRRVTQFKFAELTISDLMKYVYEFAHKHTYENISLWDWMMQNGGKTFCTEGIKTIAEGSVGSVGVALKNLQYCIDTLTFDTAAIAKYVNLSPEVQIQNAVVAIATNSKSDDVFKELSGIDKTNYTTIYQFMLSEIRKAEMLRVFGKLGVLKVKDGKEDFKVVDASTTGPEKLNFNRAKTILEGKNYTKLRDVLVNLNQEGYFTVDLFKVKLLSVYSD